MSQELRLMTKAGKTFYFASLWLDRSIRQDAAIAYCFCRAIDDIADDDTRALDRERILLDAARAVREGDVSNERARGVLSLVSKFPAIREPLAALVDACREDASSLRIKTEEDLVRYAHGVAGNVGLVMYPMLGGVAREGLCHAADLGIAMQCTNIARDVVEDLRRDRVYIPSEWLKGRDITMLSQNDPDVERVVVDAVGRVLAVAQEHYERGLAGIEYLAPRCRYAIQVAARCYAAIGQRVIRNGMISRHRVVVPLARKILIACTVSNAPVSATTVPHVAG